MLNLSEYSVTNEECRSPQPYLNLSANYIILDKPSDPSRETSFSRSLSALDITSVFEVLSAIFLRASSILKSLNIIYAAARVHVLLYPPEQ